MSYKYFRNKKCEYFPCHGDKKQNCMFCYCPLYLYMDCGGKFTILDNGWKDCSECTRVHRKDSWDYITTKLIELKETTKFIKHKKSLIEKLRKI